ncbi:histidine--tRNA ligase [Candidatus Woesearchaeota archaeon]|jgi:histidyl-tRNA synthetase|nr:histidine--tRNA ligase [Candidatus Woesearchaeota archaeon]
MIIGIMNLLNARGTRDFAPEEKIVRQRVIDRLRHVFELYGFSPLETPIVERLGVLTAKYAGGAEILKETFSFKDQGDRDLGLRYDLTVPLARFVGMNPNMKMPFKRYAIGRVFRDGPIKTGRYREFWQCDVDIVGSASMLADAQCVQIAQKFFEELGLDVNIEVSSRKLLDGILESCEIPEEKKLAVIMEIDKLKKVGLDTVQKQIKDLEVSNPAVQNLMEILATKGSNFEKLEKMKTLVDNRMAADGIKEMEEMLSYVDEKNVVLNLSLARGLTYYTGPVFEVFLKDSKKFGSSLAGGGRWDKMIGQFLGSKKEYPATGISFGIEPITAVLKLLKKEEETVKTVTQVYVIPINTVMDCLKIAEELRKADVKTDIDIVGRGISKNLNYANSLGIPYVIFVGEDELKKKKVKLRDMKTGKEEMVSVKDVVKKVK